MIASVILPARLAIGHGNMMAFDRAASHEDATQPWRD
jgi:hypothetical protein